MHCGPVEEIEGLLNVVVLPTTSATEASAFKYQPLLPTQKKENKTKVKRKGKKRKGKERKVE